MVLRLASVATGGKTLTLGAKLATRATKGKFGVTPAFAKASDGQAKTAFRAVLI
ncbi:MAG: hypothetical protein WC618_00605 [Patescibacteria group bacterium]